MRRWRCATGWSIGFDDVMGRGMQGRGHMGEFVEHREIVERWRAPDIVKIAKIRSARHRHENGVGAPRSTDFFGVRA